MGELKGELHLDLESLLLTVVSQGGGVLNIGEGIFGHQSFMPILPHLASVSSLLRIGLSGLTWLLVAMFWVNCWDRPLTFLIAHPDSKHPIETSLTVISNTITLLTSSPNTLSHLPPSPPSWPSLYISEAPGKLYAQGFSICFPL